MKLNLAGLIQEAFVFFLSTCLLNGQIGPARAQDCSDVYQTSARATFKGDFSEQFPRTIAWVGNPKILGKPIRLDVENSTNFYPLGDGTCTKLPRSGLRNGRGYLWLVLNNAIATTEDTETGGRSFVVVQVDARYKSGSSWISVARNASRSGDPIWERGGKGVGGIRPKIVKVTVKGWNDVHRQEGDVPKDEQLRVPLHATPIGDDESTWDSRDDLLLDETKSSRKISNIFISFLVADATKGEGSGIPFQVLLVDLSKIELVYVHVVSDVPDLNMNTQIRIID